MRLRLTLKSTEILSLVIAILATISLGVSLPLVIEPYNDAKLSSATILDNPPVVKALLDAQESGVHMAIHGWRHEDFQTITPDEAKDNVEKGIQVFNEAGLIPVAFIVPYGSYHMLLQSTRSAIESTGIATKLPAQTQKSDSYGWGWRDMKSFSDPRYIKESLEILQKQPKYIVLHVQDWNIYLKRMMEDYLRQANTSITVRIDDVEVNTTPETIYDMADLAKQNSNVYLVFAVIPAGTWRGGDPQLAGVRVDAIMHLYWFFFLSTTFFPFSFFITWRLTSKLSDDDPDPKDPKKEGGVSVSVIVPAFNEEDNIGRCIESIMNQDFKGKMEVIIVNDGSTDKTAEIASRYPVKLIDLKTNVGKSKALNIGMSEATGDILVFSDSDSRMARDAVRLLIEYLNEHPDVGAVAGNVLIEEHNANALTRFQMVEYRVEQEINRHLQSLNREVLVCPGPLFAVIRKIAKEIRFSDSTIVEDADFTITALRKSVKVAQEPRAKVYTKAPKSFRSWLNQRKRWWYGNLQLWKIHNGWATRNRWMMLNYLSFITSTISIVLLLLLPFLFLTYANPVLMLQRGIFYTVIPILLFLVILIPLFYKDKDLAMILLPYIVVYSTIKFVIVSYIYIRYLSGSGIKIRFGPRIMKVI